MNDDKVRLSGELPRPAAPVLPTLNPDAEKAAAEKKAAGGLSSVLYVMYAQFFNLCRRVLDLTIC